MDKKAVVHMHYKIHVCIYIYTYTLTTIKKNAFESVLMRWMKLDPIIQSEVSQKEKQQYSILTHISAGKESAYNVGDLGLIPGLERFPGEEKGYLLQYSCLENPKDRGAWQATVHGVSRVRYDLVTRSPSQGI